MGVTFTIVEATTAGVIEQAADAVWQGGGGSGSLFSNGRRSGFGSRASALPAERASGQRRKAGIRRGRRPCSRTGGALISFSPVFPVTS
jgi:hypothetical protein